jgi:hypothetical protein
MRQIPRCGGLPNSFAFSGGLKGNSVRRKHKVLPRFAPKGSAGRRSLVRWGLVSVWCFALPRNHRLPELFGEDLRHIGLVP